MYVQLLGSRDRTTQPRRGTRAEPTNETNSFHLAFRWRWRAPLNDDVADRSDSKFSLSRFEFASIYPYVPQLAMRPICDQGQSRARVGELKFQLLFAYALRAGLEKIKLKNKTNKKGQRIVSNVGLMLWLELSDEFVA